MTSPFKSLAIGAAVLAAAVYGFALRSEAHAFRPYCDDPGFCINRDGLLLDGYPMGSDSGRLYDLTTSTGGRVILKDGARATPVFVISASDHGAMIRFRGKTFGTLPEAVIVNCPSGAVALGQARFPISCR